MSAFWDFALCGDRCQTQAHQLALFLNAVNAVDDDERLVVAHISVQLVPTCAQHGITAVKARLSAQSCMLARAASDFLFPLCHAHLGTVLSYIQYTYQAM